MGGDGQGTILLLSLIGVLKNTTNGQAGQLEGAN